AALRAHEQRDGPGGELVREALAGGIEEKTRPGAVIGKSRVEGNRPADFGPAGGIALLGCFPDDALEALGRLPRSAERLCARGLDDRQPRGAELGRLLRNPGESLPTQAGDKERDRETRVFRLENRLDRGLASFPGESHDDGGRLAARAAPERHTGARPGPAPSRRSDFAQPDGAALARPPA